MAISHLEQVIRMDDKKAREKFLKTLSEMEMEMEIENKNGKYSVPYNAQIIGSMVSQYKNYLPKQSIIKNLMIIYRSLAMIAMKAIRMRNPREQILTLERFLVLRSQIIKGKGKKAITTGQIYGDRILKQVTFQKLKIFIPENLLMNKG
jgi:hypothetical protein